MHARTVTVAAAMFAAALIATPSSSQSSGQKRTPPPKTSPAPQRPQTQKPPPSRPPQRAVPRTPQTSRPPARPSTRPGTRTYVYPFPPVVDFDFMYTFPYGAYPYWRFGYPYPPYWYPQPPACIAAEAGEHGSVRIDIPQTDATVYVDGFFVGVVEDFNGATEPLNLAPGPHHFEVRAPGFQTLTFEVNVEAGRTVTYRTPLERSST